jgi:hypothetical protein
MSGPDDLNTQRERMVAALYGELDDAGLRELRRRIAADPGLRAEWDELQEARTLLRQVEPAEHAPEFVFLAPAKGRARGGWRLPALGFGLATVALLALLVSGLRVDRLDGGLALRWGPERPVLTGIPLEPATGRAAPEVRPVVAEDRGYLTRAELVTYTQELVRVMGSDLTDYDQRRSGEVLYLIHQVQDELSRRQQLDYERLDARIEEIRRALAELRAAPASGESR